MIKFLKEGKIQLIVKYNYYFILTTTYIDFLKAGWQFFVQWGFQVFVFQAILINK